MRQENRLKGQIASASGYLAVFIAPGLLAISAMIVQPILVLGVALLFFPLARILFGALPAGPPQLWDERTAVTLELLPLAYAVTLLAAVGTLLVSWEQMGLAASNVIQWALSLWVTLVFATCVAHALVHRPGSRDRMIGHLLAGVAGYPVLGYEHLRHHRMAGSTASAEWPRLDDSVWRFASRRLSRIAAETVGRQGIAWHAARGSPSVRGLRLAITATAATWGLFAAAAGWAGAVCYGVVIVLMVFSMQLITYMQHWGLGDDCTPNALEHASAWEDDCRFQCWVTLGLSLHQTHHDRPSWPYYRACPAATSPRLPAGYVLLMFAALVPWMWRRVMGPARAYWIAHPHQPLSAGRRVTCVAIYRAA